MLRIVAAMMNIRSRITGIATGDQGMFVECRLFQRVGGFPAQPLMEDIALSRLLKRAGGRPLSLHARIVTSGRRWEAGGPWRTILTMWRLRFAHWRGVDPARLVARYDSPKVRRTSSRATDRPSLLVFAKAPVEGATKTRLAAAIGNRRAVAVHRELVERTLVVAASARAAGIVGRVLLWCAPDASHPDFAAWRDRHDVELCVQRGVDLGARMRDALESALADAPAALLIGTDCPALDTDYLAEAAAALADCDAVLGPTEDGGYVLIGMSRPVDAFTGIEWGTAGVMAATRANLAGAEATWRELNVVWDVDRAADLERWEALRAEAAVTAA